MFHTHDHLNERMPKASLIFPKSPVPVCMAVIILRNELELFCHAILNVQESWFCMHACIWRKNETEDQ